MRADSGAPRDASAGHSPHHCQPRHGGVPGSGAGRLLQTIPSPALGQWAQAGPGHGGPEGLQAMLSSGPAPQCGWPGAGMSSADAPHLAGDV